MNVRRRSGATKTKAALSGEKPERDSGAWADRKPNAPAFIAEDRSPLTYGALAELMVRFGRTLNASGYGRGDRIGIVHSGGAGMASTLLGVASCATAVPLVPEYTVGEFAIHLHDRNVKGLIVEVGMDTPAPSGRPGPGEITRCVGLRALPSSGEILSLR